MMKRTLFALLVPAALSLGALDPLEKIDAYSLEVTPQLRGTRNFFPIGILGDRLFEETLFLGLNLTENIHTCYDFRTGKPCSLAKNSRGDKGTYFYNLWVAHSLAGSRDTKNYGLLKNSQKADGTSFGRHHINIFDPATRRYILDCAAASVKSVLEKDTDNITLWGIDNEWELPMDYSPESLAAFRKALRDTYQGDLARLNKAWGSEYRDFSEAVPPAAEERVRRPGAWLDWRAFQDGAYADFIAAYFRAIQEADPEKRPVISKSTQCTIEMQAVARNRALDHEVLAERTRELSHGWYGIDQYGHGDRNSYEASYLYNCIRPADPLDRSYRYGLFLAEANNHAGPGNQFAQSYWRMLANGFKGADFFVVGSFLGTRDYATFGMTRPDGVRRDRFYYTGRLASLVHRSEAFFAQAVPAEGMPRVALLLPKRDVLLADDTGVSWWDYSNNNRLDVYRRLRDMGYWVEVIPYGKLDPRFLDRFQALLLVGAEHLSSEECGRIGDFVRRGGVLLADMRAGHFNEHHEVTEGLKEVLGLRYKGVYAGIEVSPDDLWYNTPLGNVIRGDGKIVAELDAAELVNKADVFNNFKGAWITRNSFGKGTALWFNTRLGALRPESVEDKVVAEWLADRLASAGVKPAYTFGGRSETIRVEAPLVDGMGDAAFVVAGSTVRTVPAGELTVALPEGKFRTAFWASADSTRLEKMAFSVEGHTGRFQLPAVDSAGVIYLFNADVPLLGQFAEALDHAELDPHTPRFQPGETFTVRSQLVNAAGGRLRLQALEGWRVEPAEGYDVGSAEELKEFAFRVTVPGESGFFRPNRAYPLVSVYEKEGRRLAVNHMVAEVKLDLRKFELLLTDNEGVDNRFRPFSLRTGAECRFTPELPTDALTNRRGRITRFANGTTTAEFDLKAPYRVRRIVLVGAGKPYPARIAVKTDDAPEFTPELQWNQQHELEIKLDSTTRRVRLQFDFPENARFDEVEIYGSPL